MMRALTALLVFAACDDDGTVAAPSAEDPGCVSCHEGIEPIHDDGIATTECTFCHGGNGEATTSSEAHISVPADWEAIRGDALPPAPVGFIKDFAPDQLDRLDPAYLQFINPGDIRVQATTCGGCHPAQSQAMPYSIMSTNAGHYYPTLFLAGIQDERLAYSASFGAVNPDCDETIEGAVCEVTTIVPPSEEETAAVLQSGDKNAIEELANRHYLSKNCNTCHQAGYPRNDSPGLYRSSGCSACHMLYYVDGTYKGGDPTIPTGSPTHMSRHTLTTAIPVEQCATCHFQGGRIGLIYRGIREGGFSTTPEHAEVLDETLNGRAPGFYITDEDTTNDIDETPPDVHYAAGMVCADCHVNADVHGTGQILSSAKQQVGIRCEDCHGTVRERIEPDAEGLFWSAKGRPLPQLALDTNGDVFLTGRVDAAKHVAPQIVEVLARADNAAMTEAMGLDAHDWSHTEALTCDTCHTGFQQTCIGCHVSVDFRLKQIDYQTGTSSWGLTKGGRTSYSLDQVLLGTAPDGRVQSVHASQQVQMTVFGSSAFGVDDGSLLMGGTVTDGAGVSKTYGEFRDGNVGLRANIGFTPFFQHNVTKDRVRPCEACHRVDRSSEEETRIRGVYGHGTGEFMLTDPVDGSLVDGLQWLDADRNPITTWPHLGTGPLLPDVYDRAWNVVLDELP
jgi:hypothetical protein